MMRLRKKLKINNYEEKVYTVYTLEEAQEKKLPIKPWRDCSLGDWGKSDDNYVAECLGRDSYKKNTILTFPFGRQWDNEYSTLNFEEHYASKNFCNVSTKSYNEIEAKSTRASIAIDAFLSYKMAGLSPDMEQVGRLYRPDQKNPVIAAKRLLKTKEAKKMIQDKLKEVLIDREIDEGFVLDVIKEAIEVAKTKENSADMIRAAKELSLFLDMAPKTKQLVESVEIDMTHQIEENYEKQQKKLTATKKQDIDGEAYQDKNKG